MEGRKEQEALSKEMAEEVESRRKLLKTRMEECKNLSPKKLMGEMPFYTIIIDDLEVFPSL